MFSEVGGTEYWSPNLMRAHVLFLLTFNLTVHDCSSQKLPFNFLSFEIDSWTSASLLFVRSTMRLPDFSDNSLSRSSILLIKRIQNYHNVPYIHMLSHNTDTPLLGLLYHILSQLIRHRPLQYFPNLYFYKILLHY